MQTDTDNIISVTEANRKGISWIVSEAGGGRQLVVFKNNQPAAVVVPPATIDRLQDLELVADDLRLQVLALVRMVTDDGQRFDLDSVAAEFGVDLNDGDDDVAEQS